MVDVFGLSECGIKIDDGKFDYLFGRVTSNNHNAARSNQLAGVMKHLGVHDTASGRKLLTDHLINAYKDPTNISN
jgi:filamentous hemagglutinin